HGPNAWTALPLAPHSEHASAGLLRPAQIHRSGPMVSDGESRQVGHRRDVGGAHALCRAVAGWRVLRLPRTHPDAEGSAARSDPVRAAAVGYDFRYSINALR